MKQILDIVDKAQDDFLSLLKTHTKETGLTREQYVRFLSMQFHLTNGVQRHFMIAASHPVMAHKRMLRKFLVNFANEEELHYDIAREDLLKMNEQPTECPLDVSLWWSYFNSIIMEKPFIRLGATCILENIAKKSNNLIDQLMLKADYLTKANTRFVVIHKHGENLPHGDQIIEAITEANLNEEQMKDLVNGATIGSTMYLRMFYWVITGKNLA